MIFHSDKELYSVIGKNIKFFRTKSGLTQKELSEMSGISMSYLSKLESNATIKSVSISALNSIANALDIRLVRFFEKRRNS